MLLTGEPDCALTSELAYPLILVSEPFGLEVGGSRTF